MSVREGRLRTLSSARRRRARASYRLVYGLAADLIEIRRYDHAQGRAFALVVEGGSGAILVEVLKQPELAEQAEQGAEVALAAVEDALRESFKDGDRRPDLLFGQL